MLSDEELERRKAFAKRLRDLCITWGLAVASYEYCWLYPLNPGEDIPPIGLSADPRDGTWPQ